MDNLEKYIVGTKIPGWLDTKIAIGRAKVNTDEEGNMVNIVVFTTNGSSVANVGDVILNAESGLVVIPEKQAVKYKLKPQPQQTYNQKRRK